MAQFWWFAAPFSCIKRFLLEADHVILAESVRVLHRALCLLSSIPKQRPGIVETIFTSSRLSSVLTPVAPCIARGEVVSYHGVVGVV